MLALKYSINYGNTILMHETKGMVGVFTRDGIVTDLWWLGFIRVGAARRLEEFATPVRLSVNDYSVQCRVGLFDKVKAQ